MLQDSDGRHRGAPGGGGGTGVNLTAGRGGGVKPTSSGTLLKRRPPSVTVLERKRGPEYCLVSEVLPTDYE